MKIKIAIAVLFTALSLFGCFYIASSFTNVDSPPDRVLTILKSENLDFLVRRRQVTQVVLIRKANESLWDWVPYVGRFRDALKDDGILTANVRIYYGFDMMKLSDASTSYSKDKIVITLPEPEVLDFAVDLDSLKFRSLRTGIITKIGNVFRDETLKDKLQKEIKSSVNEFVMTPGTMPTKKEMLEEVTGFEKILTDSYKVKVKFN